MWTGDRGYFADGELYITGRAKDLIIIRGRNHYAKDLERVAERIEGVRAGGTAAFAIYDEQQATDLAVLVCETKLDPNDEPLCRELYLEGGLAVTRTGRLRLMMVFARSRAGLVISTMRRMMAARRAPS